MYRWDLAIEKCVPGSFVFKNYKRFGNALKVAMQVAQQSKEIFDLPADIPDEFRPTTIMHCCIRPTYNGCSTPLRNIVSITPHNHVDDHEVRGIELSFEVYENVFIFMDYYNPIKNNEDHNAFLTQYNEYKRKHAIV
jgi:hypothetical protein